MKALTLKHLAGLASAAVVALAPVAALAHGILKSATPAAGSTADVTPEAVRLTFNEGLEPMFSSVKISDANGAAVTQEKAKVDASSPNVMTVALPKLASGAYTVQWAVMTADSHKTKGTYTFKVK
ncbi:copper homeostasis periplasmic binding protein CopC [Burkholderia sp. Ac-20353]|uniref:copper homeostasis periplasmic binding protein CopC n=1 Tax=Burkholderia sp. Ac-20353 TaxID=2703894 RepID=UPI00197BD0D7|nr:copper homeostasis periplasmic binding protein CopC [Burkholderia sp. Ac-20353]MBN3786064.1 copper homeostasis periplasmic binding protein CopC [Burkholderia sp. Ac-20353]